MIRVFLFVTSVMIALSATAADSNLDWRNEYRNAHGHPCCGIHDCGRLADDDPTPMIGDRIEIENIGPATINRIHPSRDGDRWACTTGCLFVPMGV